MHLTINSQDFERQISSDRSDQRRHLTAGEMGSASARGERLKGDREEWKGFSGTTQDVREMGRKEQRQHQVQYVTTKKLYPERKRMHKGFEGVMYPKSLGRSI